MRVIFPGYTKHYGRYSVLHKHLTLPHDHYNIERKFNLPRGKLESRPLECETSETSEIPISKTGVLFGPHCQWHLY